MIYRKDLEAQALKLTAQLEQITREKNELTQEHQNNLVSPFFTVTPRVKQIIQETNQEVKTLKGELEGLREAIRNTFEDDLLQTSTLNATGTLDKKFK